MNYVRTGIRAIRNNPALGFAEIAWRWAFAAVAWIAMGLAVREILAGIDVSRLELAMANRSDAFQIADAIARVLVQVVPRFVHALAVLVPLLALVWTVAATIGRAITLRALCARSTGVSPVTPALSLVLLNGFRALFAVATLAAFFGAVFLVDSQLSPQTVAANAPLLVFGWLLVLLLVGILWGVVNWFLALAPIFAVRDGAGAGRAIAVSLSLYRDHSREYLAIASSYGLFRAAGLAIAMLAGLVVVAGAGAGTAVVLSIAIALIYCVFADILYIARLASYVSLASGPVHVAAVAVPGSADPAAPYTEAEPEN